MRAPWILAACFTLSLSSFGQESVPPDQYLTDDPASKFSTNENTLRTCPFAVIRDNGDIVIDWPCAEKFAKDSNMSMERAIALLIIAVRDHTYKNMER